MEKTAQWVCDEKEWNFWDECYEVELDSHVIYMEKSMRIVVGATSS